MDIPVIERVDLIVHSGKILLVHFRLILFQHGGKDFLVNGSIQVVILFQQLLHTAYHLLFFRLKVEVQNFKRKLNQFRTIDKCFTEISQGTVYLTTIAIIQLQGRE